MTVKELYAALEARIPRSLSLSWDNDGLMCCPDPQKEVRRVLVALDITEAVAKYAVEEGYDLILSHHPLIFRPLRALEPGDPVAKKVIRLLGAGVSAMSFHTRLDAVCGGVNDRLCELLGLTDAIPFGNDGEQLGRIGFLPQPMSTEDFAKQVKQATGAPFVSFSDAGLPVYRVAVLGGSGSDEAAAAKAAGADTYLSGELSHHHMTDAPENGINLLSAGHYFTEQPICEVLCRLACEQAPGIEVKLFCSNALGVV